MEKVKKKICAIICEYNPFHTGHKFLIDKAKEITNADYMLGLMSGNFSQRSEPTILNKYTRSEIAILNGLDLVLNLPTAFCTNNAEVFALSSIKILNNINVDYIAFGMETVNEKATFTLANFLLKEPKSFKKDLKNELKKGLSYNTALQNTIKNNINIFSKELQEDIINLVSLPNNILGLEYIKALIKTKSKIKPIIVKRVNNYNNNLVLENFKSASSIREEILNKNFENIKEFLPINSHKYFTNFNLNLDTFKNILFYKIKTTSAKKIKNIYSVNEGLENRISNLSKSYYNFDEFYKNLQSKRYKQNKLNAILLNILLGIDKKIIKKLYTIKNNIIVKILAINSKNTDILKEINTKNLILRKNDINKIKNKFNKKIMQIENNANIIYNLISKESMIENDYYNKLVKTSI